MKTSLPLLLAASSLLACGYAAPEPAARPDATEAAAVAPAPLLGESGGPDAADRRCRVVLRQVFRRPGETECQTGTCFVVWRAQLDVSKLLLTVGGAPGVLFTSSGTAGWYEAGDAVAIAGAPADFQRYEVRIANHTFDPAKPLAGQTVRFVAFMQITGGRGRLFDHNRLTGSYESFSADAAKLQSVPEDSDICPAPDHPYGLLRFNDDWSEQQRGLLAAGGVLGIDYDLDRLPSCRGTHNGAPAWAINATVQFLPNGETSEWPVMLFKTDNGFPTNQATTRRVDLPIPDGATSATLWFHNYTGAGSSCDTWDSDFGRNYRFRVLGPQ